MNAWQNIYAYESSGRRYDTGERMGYFEEIIDVALEQDDLRGELLEDMQGVVGRVE